MSVVYIDWDYPFADRYDSKFKIRFVVQRDMSTIKEKFGEFTTEIRESPHHRMHLRITTSKDLNDFEMFLFRAAMRDDPARLAIDLKRYTFNGRNETNRIFDIKMIVSGSDIDIVKAGEWQAYDI